MRDNNLMTDQVTTPIVTGTIRQDKLIGYKANNRIQDSFKNNNHIGSEANMENSNLEKKGKLMKAEQGRTKQIMKDHKRIREDSKTKVSENGIKFGVTTNSRIQYRFISNLLNIVNNCP